MTVVIKAVKAEVVKEVEVEIAIEARANIKVEDVVIELEKEEVTIALIISYYY